MSEYTPTTKEVRADYIDAGWGADGSLYGDNDPAQFDRWLASVKAEAWDDGHDVGWESRHEDALSGYMPRGAYESDRHNPYREVVE